MTGVERQLAQLQTTLGPDEAAPSDDTTPPPGHRHPRTCAPQPMKRPTDTTTDEPDDADVTGELDTAWQQLAAAQAAVLAALTSKGWR
ncbi:MULTISPECIES: hypothetical protein [unclassified Kitasatospora]|uniref:hypothetical protein n=1 Tax=unclassified Kitasatospora TaxID=2633591 RepID=UPI0034177547